MNLSLNKTIGAVIVGVMLMSCSPDVPKQIAPPAPGEKVSEDNGGDIVIPKVDILFVIDNSGSMQTHQNNLAMNIGAFTQAFGTINDLDYHIGVISTDDGTDSWGGGNGDCCGKLIGSPKVVTNTTPQRDRVLSQNILIGTDGSGTEKVFSPVLMALSEKMLKTENAGFLRAEATLVTIFITDAEENGRETANDLYSGLLRLKRGDPNRVLGYGVIVPSWETRCARDAGDAPVKIEEYLTMVINGAANTNVMSLCSRTFGTELVNLADDIVRQISSVMLLNQLPDVSTIKVMYGTEVLPEDSKKGWAYDPARNAIVLGKEINWKSQPKGTKIQVFYRQAKTNDKP